MAKVIGIMGLAGAGKDTVAAMLQRGLVGAGLEVSLGKFADYMYRIARHVFNEQSLTDRKLKETPHSFGRETFEAALQFGIDKELLHVVSNELARCDIYCYMVTLCEQFLDAPGTYQGYKISPRQFLQNLGDAGKRAVHELWTEIGFADFAKRRGIVLVTDARFHTECAKLDAVLYVKRPGVAPVSPHRSEALAAAINDGLCTLPGIEFIDNDSTLEDLEVEVATYAASQALFFGSAIQES